MSIESNKKYKACLLVFKYLKRTSIEVMNTCLEPLNHNQNTRNNKCAARIPRVRTEAGKKAFWSKDPNYTMNFQAAFASWTHLLFLNISLNNFLLHVRYLSIVKRLATLQKTLLLCMRSS